MTDDLAFLPPHEPTWAEGFHAYSQKLSAKPGEEVEVRVSNDGPVRAEALRYRGSTVAGGVPIAQLPQVEARPQPIHRGSYVYVERGLEEALRSDVDLVIADLKMPGMSGIELTGALRQAGLQTRIGDIYVGGNHTRVGCWELRDESVAPVDALSLARDETFGQG